MCGANDGTRTRLDRLHGPAPRRLRHRPPWEWWSRQDSNLQRAASETAASASWATGPDESSRACGRRSRVRVLDGQGGWTRTTGVPDPNRDVYQLTYTLRWRGIAVGVSSVGADVAEEANPTPIRSSTRPSRGRGIAVVAARRAIRSPWGLQVAELGSMRTSQVVRRMRPGIGSPKSRERVLAPPWCDGPGTPRRP